MQKTNNKDKVISLVIHTLSTRNVVLFAKVTVESDTDEAKSCITPLFPVI